MGPPPRKQARRGTGKAHPARGFLSAPNFIFIFIFILVSNFVYYALVISPFYG
jgi:hypothetical protein